MSGKSESEKERRCNRSACWHFYDKTPGGGFCRICQKEILTQAGGTTNLRNHLRRRHGELWTATMENRLDPSTLTITDRRSILTENLGNQSSTLKLSMAPQDPVPDSSVDFGFYTNGEAIAPSDEEPREAAVGETNSAVHTIQAYRDAAGTTFLYLHPAPEAETNMQVDNGQFQPVVANAESIAVNGEMVPVAVQKDPSAEGQAVDGDGKNKEDATPRRTVHAPVKNHQGSSVASRAVVRQMNRPNPITTVSSAISSNNHVTKEDTYDAFGKYIASMLRGLPSKTACKLQGEIVNWILKEQMKSNSS